MPRRCTEKQLAIFDFDGTITTKDSINYFYLSCFGVVKFFLVFCRNLLYIFFYLLSVISNAKIKSKLCKGFISGVEYEIFVEMSILFSEKCIPNIENKKCVDRIKWHKKQGHTVVVVSASPKEWIIPWAQRTGVDGVVATNVEVVNGRVTGVIKEKDNCYGGNKVAMLRKYIPDLDDYYIYSYADSRSDAAILEIADEAFYRKYE